MCASVVAPPTVLVQKDNSHSEEGHRAPVHAGEGCVATAGASPHAAAPWRAQAVRV